MSVQHVAAQRFALQAEHIDVPTAFGQVLALLRMLLQFLERPSAECGVDGTVRHLYIAKAHNACRDAVTLRYLEAWLSVGAHANGVPHAVPQVVYLQHFAQLGSGSQYPVTRIVVDEAAPCLRQGGTGVPQSVFVRGCRHGRNAPRPNSPAQ